MTGFAHNKISKNLKNNLHEIFANQNQLNFEVSILFKLINKITFSLMYNFSKWDYNKKNIWTVKNMTNETI